MPKIDETPSHRLFALPGARPQYGPDKRVRVEAIDLDVTLDLPGRKLSGTATTTVRALDEAVDRLELDAVDLAIDSVICEGKPLAFERRDDRLIVHFAPALEANQSVAFAVAYETTNPRQGLFFVEPTAEYPHKSAHAWTQSQDENARYWFPCLDYPHEKQRTSTTIRVARGLFALGNGELVERRDEGAQTIFRYVQEIGHSTYLMTLVVGPFVEVLQGNAGRRDVPVAYYVLPGREADGERAFSKTPAMIACFEGKTGAAYPYARYSQIAVSDFIFGGMENTSATTQTDRTLHDERAHLDFSSDPLVSHELAHQWFGDLLTCRDWSHAWLNEGFATYFECVWREADLGYDEYLYDVFECVDAYLDEDATRYRRPIVCNRFRDPIELFDRHLYQKGGAVLHMLRGELGEARFWRSIRHYVERNAQRNVETIDLIRAIEDATGRNLREFFDQWVFRGGHPELEITCEWDEKRKVATVGIDQKQTIDAEHPAYAFEVELGFVSELPVALGRDARGEALPGERRIHARIERANEKISVALDAAPTLVRFDPGAFILAQTTFKLGVEFAMAALANDGDVVARIRALRELCKDGSQSAQHALEGAVAHELFWGVLAQLAIALGKTHAPWARDLLLRLLAHAHPKVRRAAADALGVFREAAVADALLRVAQADASYFVQAAALAALGKTRDARAFGVLESASKSVTWNGVVEAGAVRGLAELGDPRATEAVIAASRLGADEGVRRAVPTALARIAALVESERARILPQLEELLDDGMFLVQLAAIAAAETLEDSRLLPTLARLSESGVDGRVRRDAAEALIRIREAQRVPAQVGALREDLDDLRVEQRKLAEKLAALSAR